MRIDLDGPIEPSPAPEGIAIGGIEAPRDLPAVHAILVDAFTEDFHDPGPYEPWAADMTGTPGYDPDLWLMARDGERPVGVLTASLGDDRGWVDYLGVAAAYRGRGIATALLRRSFADLAERGMGSALVSVDSENPTGASGVYARAGMRTVKRWDLWERVSGG
jgi:ribosomal protein S18 acetylase RimI-like enzyme